MTPRSSTRSLSCPPVARRLRLLGYGLGAAITLVVGLALAERALWRGRVLPGVRLASVGVDGRPFEEARRALSQRAVDLEHDRLVALAGPERFSFTPAEVGLDLDEDGALTALRRAGRSGNLLTQAAGVVLRRLRPVEVGWQARYDGTKLARAVDAWAARFDTMPQDGGVRIEGGTAIAVPPVDGRTLVRPAARDLVRDALHGRADPPLRLPIETRPPAIGQEEVDRILAEAGRVLAGPATVVVEGRPIALPAHRLGGALRVVTEGGSLRLELPDEALHAPLAPGLAGLEQPPRDARFVVEGEPPAVRIEESAVGRGLDTRPVAEALLRGERRVEGRLIDVVPRIDTARAHALRIIEPVSTFTTEHAGGQPRVKNIHRVADILQDRVILPGERFSLNQAVGPRTRQRGFVRAPVIYEGEFTQDVGGGVSQFATTFFNAAFFGGYKIVSHRPHTYYISRYPQGREATVSFPQPDLVIENDSTSGILVRTSYTDTSITVTFFGDREGKTVRAEGPKVGRRSKGGYNVEVYRVIERPGQAVQRERFLTRYKTQPRKAPRRPAPAQPAQPAQPAPSAPAPPPPAQPPPPGPSPPPA
jgi:vancomycin resistance protein YoaR